LFCHNETKFKKHVFSLQHGLKIHLYYCNVAGKSEEEESWEYSRVGGREIIEGKFISKPRNLSVISLFKFNI